MISKDFTNLHTDQACQFWKVYLRAICCQGACRTSWQHRGCQAIACFASKLPGTGLCFTRFLDITAVAGCCACAQVRLHHIVLVAVHDMLSIDIAEEKQDCTLSNTMARAADTCIATQAAGQNPHAPAQPSTTPYHQRSVTYACSYTFYALGEGLQNHLNSQAKCAQLHQLLTATLPVGSNASRTLRVGFANMRINCTHVE